MTILIVEQNFDLAEVWKLHLEELGHEVELAADQSSAIQCLQAQPVTVMVLNIELEAGSALDIADFAGFRYPAVKVLFTGTGRTFADGSIFSLAGNAIAYIAAGTDPRDLALMVDHHAKQPS